MSEQTETAPTPAGATDTDDVILCPLCNGLGYTGEYVIRERAKRLTCRLCLGFQIVTEEKAEMYREGRRRREDRVSRGLSGREEARRLGIEPLALNHMEQGRIAFPISGEDMR